MTSSYRDSHKGKGLDYDQSFSDRPYPRLMWEMERKTLDCLVDEITPKATTYLDFACGTGRVLGHLESRVAFAVGVDVARSMLNIAKTKVDAAELIEADLTLGSVFRPRSFDLITAFRFFPNAEPTLRRAVMDRLAELLRPQGYLVINNHRPTSSLRNRLKRVVGRRDGMSLSHAELIALTAACGLAVDRVVHLGIWPGSEARSLLPMWLLRALEELASKFPFLCEWSNNLVYVIRRPLSP